MSCVFAASLQYSHIYSSSLTGGTTFYEKEVILKIHVVKKKGEWGEREIIKTWTERLIYLHFYNNVSLYYGLFIFYMFINLININLHPCQVNGSYARLMAHIRMPFLISNNHWTSICTVTNFFDQINYFLRSRSVDVFF